MSQLLNDKDHQELICKLICDDLARVFNTAQSDKEVKEDMAQEAKRYNSDKPQLAYVFEFPAVIEALARIMEFGAIKYDDGNWKLGNKPDKEYWDSFTRHLMALKKGEVYDPDSGCSHLGQMIWNLCAMFQLNHPDAVYESALFQDRCEFWREKRNAENNLSS